jgi:hypothetical protein
MAGKEMIGAGEEHHLFGIGSRINHARKLVCVRELVLISTEEELGDGAFAETGVLVAAAIRLDGQSERNESGGCNEAGTGTAGGDGHGGAEAESDGYDGELEFVLKPVESGFDVCFFRLAVMPALTAARAAKVEAKHRPTEPERRIVDGLHGVVDNFVVKSTAEERMRMAD